MILSLSSFHSYCEGKGNSVTESTLCILCPDEGRLAAWLSWLSIFPEGSKGGASGLLSMGSQSLLSSPSFAKVFDPKDEFLFFIQDFLVLVVTEHCVYLALS